jgi:hypothetical protein
LFRGLPGAGLRGRDRIIRRQVQANAAWCVAGRVNDLRFIPTPAKDIAFPHQLIDVRFVRGFPAEPRCLHVEHAVQVQVVGMQIDRSAGCFVHAAQTDDVIDMGVRNRDGRYLQMMLSDHFQDSAGIVARIDNDRFARQRVTDNVAIALQHADRKDFVNEFLGFRHTLQYNIGGPSQNGFVPSFVSQFAWDLDSGSHLTNGKPSKLACLSGAKALVFQAPERRG